MMNGCRWANVSFTALTDVLPRGRTALVRATAPGKCGLRQMTIPALEPSLAHLTKLTPAWPQRW
jgi:hypothetical protein